MCGARCQVPSWQCSGSQGSAGEPRGSSLRQLGLARLRCRPVVLDKSGVVLGGRSGRNCGAMLSWLQDVLWPSKAPKSDYDDLAFEILFEDLDRNGDGVVDITELRDGLEHWNSSFGIDPEKVSH